MRVCSYSWKLSCFHLHCCRCTWCLTFWVLWICDVSQIDHKTLFLRRSDRLWHHKCLHVHFSEKRQQGVYHSPLNLVWPVWHYKHACVSGYMWRHKLGSYTRLIGNISIKRLMAPTTSVSVATVCTTNKSQWGKIFSVKYRNLTLHFPSVSCWFKSWDMLCLSEILE